jgi:hypothetical protein
VNCPVAMVDMKCLVINKVLLVFLLCFVTTLVVHAQDADDPDALAPFDSKVGFKDFKAPVYKGPIAKLNIHSSHTARLFRTVLREGYKKPEVNFAGHYVLVYWGCGSPCKSGAIIDVKNGKVYDIPTAGEDYDYKPDSRMLFINPPMQNPPDTGWYYFKNRIGDMPAIWIFNERTKKFKEYHNK